MSDAERKWVVLFKLKGAKDPRSLTVAAPTEAAAKAKAQRAAPGAEIVTARRAQESE